MTGYAELLLKTYFKFKRKQEDPTPVSPCDPAEPATPATPVSPCDPPALDPVYDAITNCNWKSMGAFTNAVEQQKSLSMLTDELLRSVSLGLGNDKLKEEIAVETKEEEKEEKKDLWAQLIDIAEDPTKEENKHD